MCKLEKNSHDVVSRVGLFIILTPTNYQPSDETTLNFSTFSLFQEVEFEKNIYYLFPTATFLTHNNNNNSRSNSPTLIHTCIKVGTLENVNVRNMERNEKLKGLHDDDDGVSSPHEAASQ